MHSIKFIKNITIIIVILRLYVAWLQMALVLVTMCRVLRASKIKSSGFTYFLVHF